MQRPGPCPFIQLHNFDAKGSLWCGLHLIDLGPYGCGFLVHIVAHRKWHYKLVWVGGYCIRAQVTKLSSMLIFSKLGTANSLIYILMGGLVNHTKSSNFCQEMQVFRHSSYSILCLNLIFQVGLHITFVLMYFLLMFLYAWIFNQMQYPHVISRIMWIGLDSCVLSLTSY